MCVSYPFLKYLVEEISNKGTKYYCSVGFTVGGQLGPSIAEVLDSNLC